MELVCCEDFTLLRWLVLAAVMDKHKAKRIEISWEAEMWNESELIPMQLLLEPEVRAGYKFQWQFVYFNVYQAGCCTRIEYKNLFWFNKIFYFCYRERC